MNSRNRSQNLGDYDLDCQWTLWCSKETKVWQPEQVATFSNAVELAKSMNDFILFYDLPDGADFLFLRNQIMPEWDDEANKSGCQLCIQLRRTHDNYELSHQLWLWTILALIGNKFQKKHAINGVRASSRPNDLRIELWLNTQNPLDINSIKQEWAEGLNHPVFSIREKKRN